MEGSHWLNNSHSKNREYSKDKNELEDDKLEKDESNEREDQTGPSSKASEDREMDTTDAENNEQKDELNRENQLKNNEMIKDRLDNVLKKSPMLSMQPGSLFGMLGNRSKIDKTGINYPLEKYLDPNRPYKCDVCKESFTQKNILLVHYNSVSHLHKLKRTMQEHQQKKDLASKTFGNSGLSQQHLPQQLPSSSANEKPSQPKASSLETTLS